MQIRSTAWTLTQLLALAVDEAFPHREVAPWREGHPLTAGLVAQWLRIEFTGLAFRDGYDPKSQIKLGKMLEFVPSSQPSPGRRRGFLLKFSGSAYVPGKVAATHTIVSQI
jgi:hypothetical protein